MKLWCIGLVLALGCGSKAAIVEDDQPPGDGPDGVDACATCAGDTGTFVSSMTGADTNPGTKAMPFKTIGAGIAAAKLLGGTQPVYVAQGVYPEKVTLAEGIEIGGGYECNAGSCSWSRDLAMFESTINNQDFEGVLAGPTITPATVFGGFKVVGKDGVPPLAPGSVGITVAGGSPTLRGNKIVGGTVTGGGAAAADRSIGIALRTTGTAAAVIENNEVTAGPAVGVSAALSLEAISGVSSLATIDANVLRGGTARRSDGVMAFGAAAGTMLVNNDIIAGSSTNGASLGVEVSSRMTIDRNRINLDPSVGTCTTPTQWCAGIASVSATLTITNNVISGPKGPRTAGVFLTEQEIPGGLVILNANYVSGGGIGGNPSATTRTESSAVVVSIGACNTCGLKGQVGRVRNNILDGGNNQNRYGVREDPAQGRTTRVELLDANDIWFVGGLAARIDTLYRQVTNGGNPVDTKLVSLLNQMTVPPATLNQNADPLINATYHINASSPCANAGVSTEAPPIDFDGQARPSGAAVDIGADEI
jgi:hypothetical protein